MWMMQSAQGPRTKKEVGSYPEPNGRGQERASIRQAIEHLQEKNKKAQEGKGSPAKFGEGWVLETPPDKTKGRLWGGVEGGVNPKYERGGKVTEGNSSKKKRGDQKRKKKRTLK